MTQHFHALRGSAAGRGTDLPHSNLSGKHAAEDDSAFYSRQMERKESLLLRNAAQLVRVLFFVNKDLGLKQLIGLIMINEILN